MQMYTKYLLIIDAYEYTFDIRSFALMKFQIHKDIKIWSDF